MNRVITEGQGVFSHELYQSQLELQQKITEIERLEVNKQLNRKRKIGELTASRVSLANEMLKLSEIEIKNQKLSSEIDETNEVNKLLKDRELMLLQIIGEKEEKIEDMKETIVLIFQITIDYV